MGGGRNTMYVGARYELQNAIKLAAAATACRDGW